MEQPEKKSLIRKLISSLIKKQKLRKNPIYKSQPMQDELIVKKSIQGDFNQFQERLLKESLIALIFGKRGSGKTALAFRLLENIYEKTNRKCFALGIQQTVMPKWISTVHSVEEVPNNSLVIIDEGALSFSSRDSMASKNKNLSKLLAIARHKDLSLFFITQNTGLIDKNILALADTLLIKEGSLLQLEMERPQIKKFYEKANKSFLKIKGDKKSSTFIIDNDFEGVISHSLPSFWTDKLSKNRSI
jgi:DNA helicase HerA-like ATPase